MGFAKANHIQRADFGIEFTTILGHEPDADQIDTVRPLNQFDVEPIFHVSPLTDQPITRPKTSHIVIAGLDPAIQATAR